MLEMTLLLFLSLPDADVGTQVSAETAGTARTDVTRRPPMSLDAYLDAVRTVYDTLTTDGPTIERPLGTFTDAERSDFERTVDDLYEQLVALVVPPGQQSVHLQLVLAAHHLRTALHSDGAAVDNETAQARDRLLMVANDSAWQRGQ